MGGHFGHFGMGGREEMLSALQAGLFRLPFSPGATRSLAKMITDHLLIDLV